MCISVDLPEPDGPIIAVKRAAGNATATSPSASTGGLALAVATAQSRSLDDRLQPLAARGIHCGQVYETRQVARCAAAGARERRPEVP